MWEPRCAAPRAGALPALLFTRWPLRRAAPRRRGRKRWDSGAETAADRAAPPPPPRSQGRRSEPCRWAHESGGPGAAGGEGAGVWGSCRDAAYAGPGGACEWRSGRAPFIESRSGPPEPCNSCRAASANAGSPSPSLFLSPSLLSSLPVLFPAKEAPAGSYRRLLQVPSPGPSPNPNTREPRFWPEWG